MEGAEEELERRSKFLESLIKKKKAMEQEEQHDCLNVRVRASDMPLPLQNCAFRCARDQLDSMPSKLDSKRLALALKKVIGRIRVQKNLAGTTGDWPLNYSSRHTMDELQELAPHAYENRKFHESNMASVKLQPSLSIAQENF